MTPYIPNLDGPCHCGACENALTVLGPASGGKFPGQYYLHCMKCHWHYTFAIHLKPPLVVPHIQPPSMSLATQTVKTCTQTPCKKHAHATCKNKSCRFCCTMLGGCDAKGHTPAALSENQLRKAQGIKALPKQTRSQLQSSSSRVHSTFPVESTSESSLQELTPQFRDFLQQTLDSNPMRILEKHEAQRVEDERKELELDQQEDLDFQQALEQSRREMLRVLASSSSPPLPMSISSMALASSSSSHHSSESHAAFSTGSTSVLPTTKVTPKNRPSITTQMNAEWMREYQDRTKEPIRGRSQVDVELVRKFRVVWWESSQLDPAIFAVQVGSLWPKWKITDSRDTLSQVGAQPVQFYDFNYSQWIEIPLDYAHTVKTDGYLFLRRRGVECQNFKTQLALVTQKTHHQRTFMTNERKFIKSSLKKEQARNTTPIFDSDDEVEFVGYSQSPKRVSGSPLKRSIKLEPEDDSVALKKPRLQPLIIPGSSHGSFLNPISVPGSPHSSSSLASSSATSLQSFFPFSALSSRSATPPISSIPASPASPIPSSPIPHSIQIASPLTGPPPILPGKSWPSNMYVVDMVHGFRRMDEVKRCHGDNFEERFYMVFGQKAPAVSTYHDQVRRWNLADQDTRDAALHAGRRSAGHWSRFSKSVPLRGLGK